MSTSTQAPANPLLLCEVLGFAPQLLLDDIINIANNAVQDGVNGMEEFVIKWAATRHSASAEEDSDVNKEIEQALVSFQTLLEYHTDIAFDFFEAWCLRNIFYIPPDLPVVLPHQTGLDLVGSSEKEAELMQELEDLRKELQRERQANRLLKRAAPYSERARANAEHQLSQLGALNHLSGASKRAAEQLVTLYKTFTALPPMEPIAPLTVPPGKREWEGSALGYANWAAKRLVARVKEEDVGRPEGSVGRLVQAAAMTGDAQEMRDAVSAMGGVDDREDRA